MSLIRPRQRVVTAVFPHNANRRFIIPSRFGGAEPPAPPVAEGYRFALTVGELGPGGNAGFLEFTYGALTPGDTESGNPVVQIACSGTSTIVAEFLNDVVGNPAFISIMIEGEPEYLDLFQSTTKRYQAGNGGKLFALLKANVGNTLGVNMFVESGAELLLNPVFAANTTSWQALNANGTIAFESASTVLCTSTVTGSMGIMAQIANRPLLAAGVYQFRPYAGGTVGAGGNVIYGEVVAATTLFSQVMRQATEEKGAFYNPVSQAVIVQGRADLTAAQSFYVKGFSLKATVGL